MWWVVGIALWVAGGFVASSTYDPQPAYHDLQKPNQPNKPNELNRLNKLNEPNKPNKPNELNKLCPLGHNDRVIGFDGNVLIQVLTVGDFLVIHPDGYILAVFPSQQQDLILGGPFGETPCKREGL